MTVKKSLLTLCGWVAVGAIIAFGARLTWKTFKKNSPDRSKVIAEKMRETIDSGKVVAKETIKAIEKEVKNSIEKETESVSTRTDEVESKNFVKNDDTKENVPTIGTPTPIDRENEVEERLYAIASGQNSTVATPKSVVEKKETTTEYERRQNKLRRKEEALIQRQMRIVDELTGS